MSRRLYLQPEAVEEKKALPFFLTHAEWCRWLKSRGQLAPSHRRCIHAEHCVAHHHLTTAP